LPPGVNPIAVKYIVSYRIKLFFILYQNTSHYGWVHKCTLKCLQNISRKNWSE